MNHPIRSFLRSCIALLAVGTLLVACSDPAPTVLTQLSLIPKPLQITDAAGYFELKAESAIQLENPNEELSRLGEYVGTILRPATGFTLPVASGETTQEGRIVLRLLSEPDTALAQEGYRIQIEPTRVMLSANTTAGIFWAIQTLRQTLPAAIERSSVQSEKWRIAAGTIQDAPTYAYRGAMLDVARHFFSVEDVKHYIDQIAAYKLNVMHLHLSDDQGWRIEIKSWPNLTELGSRSEVGDGPGGFYTQAQYSDIVRYAQERYVTIIPEIDMPGHTNSALASYPELNCDGKARELYRGIEVGFSTLCTSSETTYRFVDDVVRELAALTPGAYIHVGGDESHVTPMKDYIPFINRVQDIVRKHGKQMIGWDEVTNASLHPTSVAQYWAKAEYAQSAAKQKAKLIMSPAKKAYLDMQYDSTTAYGLHWAAYIEVDSAYMWDPATMVEGVTQADILGVESPLWTETITKRSELEYMAFPRILGHAEIGWTPTALRSWDDYRTRLGGHAARLQAKDINFYRSALVDWKP